MVIVEEDRPNTSSHLGNIIPPVSLKSFYKTPSVTLKGHSSSTFHLEKSSNIKPVLLSKNATLKTADDKVSEQDIDWETRRRSIITEELVTRPCLVTEQRKQLSPVPSSIERQFPNPNESISLVEPRVKKTRLVAPLGSKLAQCHSMKPRLHYQNPAQRLGLVIGNPLMPRTTDSRPLNPSSRGYFLSSGPRLVNQQQALTNAYLSRLTPGPSTQFQAPAYTGRGDSAEALNVQIRQDSLKCGYCNGPTFPNWDMVQKHFYEFHLANRTSSFAVEGRTVRMMQNQKSLSEPNTLEPIISQVFSMSTALVHDQVQVTSTSTSIKQEPGSGVVQDSDTPKIDQVFSVRKKMLLDPKSNRVIVKNINTAEGHSFMTVMALQGNLSCGYCSGVKFSDMNNIKTHIKDKHSALGYTGFVIENNQVKLIAAFNKNKDNDAGKQEKPCTTPPDPLEIQDKETTGENLKQKELELRRLKNPEPVLPKASPGFRRSQKLNDAYDLSKFLPNPESLHCIYCPLKLFRNWSALKNHIYMAHISSSYRVLGLPESQWELDFKKDLSHNLDPVLSFDLCNNKPDEFKCPYCQTIYKTKRGLKIHAMGRHKPELEKSRQKFLMSKMTADDR